MPVPDAPGGAIVDVRSGLGWDSHRLVAGRPLILGGVTIESDLGLDGHTAGAGDRRRFRGADPGRTAGLARSGCDGAHPGWRHAGTAPVVRRLACLQPTAIIDDFGKPVGWKTADWSAGLAILPCNLYMEPIRLAAVPF